MSEQTPEAVEFEARVAASVKAAQEKEEATSEEFLVDLSMELQITNEVIQKLALLPEDGYQRVMAAISLFLDRDVGDLEYADKGGSSFRSTLRVILPQFVAVLGMLAKSGNNTAAYIFSMIDPVLQVVSADPDCGFKYQTPLTAEEAAAVNKRAVSPFEQCYFSEVPGRRGCPNPLAEGNSLYCVEHEQECTAAGGRVRPWPRPVSAADVRDGTGRFCEEPLCGAEAVADGQNCEAHASSLEEPLPSGLESA